MGEPAADIQRREEEAQKQQRQERERGEARNEETLHSAEEGVAKKPARTDIEMDTKGGAEAGTSQAQSRHKNGA